MGRPFNEPDEEVLRRLQHSRLASDSSSNSDVESDTSSESDDTSDSGDSWNDPSQGNVLTLLMRACELGDESELCQLIPSLNVSIDTPGEDSDSLLHIAALYGHIGCVQRLLEAGARVDVLDEEGATPLHDASAGGYKDICILLLDKDGSILDITDTDGDTALHAAARGDHMDVVQLLLDRGANPLKENKDMKLPRALASRESEVREILLKAEEEHSGPRSTNEATD